MYKYIFYSLLATASLTACKKDQDTADKPIPPANDVEVLTSLILEIRDTTAGAAPVLFAFRDLDAEGANVPVEWDTIFLQANRVFDTRIIVLNEIAVPTDTISIEIEEEADEHLFCFESNVPGLGVVRTDSDGQYEVGLSSRWTTSAAAAGNMTITLKHQPGVKNGSCEPGDTDIEVVFPCVIE